MLVGAAVDRVRAPGFDPCAMSQPSHIYASTARRRRPIWPYATAALAVVAAVAAVLLGGL